MRYPRTRGFGLAGFAALLFCAPAYAANEEAPGLLKKEPLPVPTVVEPVAPPAPTLETAPGTPKSPAKTGIPRSPKKTTTAPAPLPSSASARAQARRARTTTSSSRRGTTRAAGKASSRAPASSRSGSSQAAPNDTVPATRAAAARELAQAAERSGKRVTEPVMVDPPPVPSGEFALARAAERVVEVIPRTVLLALAGMLMLTLLLMLRTVTAERRGLRQLRETYEATVHSLATAVEAKDDTTGGHIERVRDLGLLLAREVVPRQTRDPQMAWGFLLHDIGKLAVPDAVLRKPGRLDDLEWALMRRHAEEGVRILEGVPFLDKALDVVRHHHERWDGGGYPAGLVAEEIPLWARIFAVVDTLDAITSTRPYRPRQTLAAAIEEIRRCSGTQFDPAVVDALEQLDLAAVENLLEHEPEQPVAEAPARRQAVAA